MSFPIILYKKLLFYIYFIKAVLFYSIKYAIDEKPNLL